MIDRYDIFMESKKKFPNIKTLTINDYTILIGRDAASNDYLSTIMAKPNDLWFHVKGKPGSHVIIRFKDRLFPNEIKKEVAILTAKNSKVKGKCIVVCCKAKFVTKTSNMNVGQVKVDYKNAEEIEIEI